MLTGEWRTALGRFTLIVFMGKLRAGYRQALGLLKYALSKVEAKVIATDVPGRPGVEDNATKKTVLQAHVSLGGAYVIYQLCDFHTSPPQTTERVEERKTLGQGASVRSGTRPKIRSVIPRGMRPMRRVGIYFHEIGTENVMPSILIPKNVC